MIIDISECLKENGAAVEVNGKLSLKEQTFLGTQYSFKEPLAVSGTVSNNGQTLTLKALCKGSVSTQCARCLKDIEPQIEFEIEEALVNGETEIPKEDEDVFVFDGHEVDIDEIVLKGFLMNVPGKYLCKSGCKGLCPKCGKDLNEGECSCGREEIDPRWAGLAEIMKNNS